MLDDATMSDHHHHDHVHREEPGHFHGDFDELAETWDDDPQKVERARIVAARIVERLAPTSATRLLEYGAGTGLVAEALADRVGAMTLADPSAGMRAAMAAKVDAGSLPADARIVDLDLAAEPRPDDRYDLAVAVQVLHHVADLDPVLAGFAAVVERGGRLCVVDLEAEDGSFHAEGFAGHHGFERNDLAARIEGAGFRDVVFEHAYDLQRDGRTYPLFLAIATR